MHTQLLLAVIFSQITIMLQTVQIPVTIPEKEATSEQSAYISEKIIVASKPCAVMLIAFFSHKYQATCRLNEGFG